MPEDELPEPAMSLSQDALDALLAAADAEISVSDAEVLPETETPPPAAAVAFSSFDAPTAAADDLPGISRVKDIPLEVTVELGRTRLLIRDILELGTGSIIELDKIAGEPVDLYANGLLVARGEVIVIDDNFGVRVTEVVTAQNRLSEGDSHAAAA